MAEETKSGIGDMTELLQKQNETTAAVEDSKKAQLRAAVLSKSSLRKDLGEIYKSEKDAKDAAEKAAADEKERANKKRQEKKDADKGKSKIWQGILDTNFLNLKELGMLDKSFSEGFGDVKDAFSSDIAFLKDMLSPLTAIPGVSTALTAIQFVTGKIFSLLFAENRKKLGHWMLEKKNWAWQKARDIKANLLKRKRQLTTKSGREGLKKKGKAMGNTALQNLMRFGKVLFALLLAPIVFVGVLAKEIWAKLKVVRTLIAKPFQPLIKWIKGFKLPAGVTSFFQGVRTFFSTSGPIGGVFAKLQGMFNKVGTFIKNSKILGFVGGLAKGLAKLFWPITVIWGAVEAVKGFMAGWGSTEGGGIMEKLISGFAGISSALVNFLIGMPLDLIKNFIAWILGKLGIIGEDTQKAIEDFSFGDLISGFFTWMANLAILLWTFIKAIGVGAWEAIKAMWPGGEGPLEAFARGFKETMAARGKSTGVAGGGKEMSAEAIESGAEEADEAERDRHYAAMDASGEGWGTQARINSVANQTVVNQGNKTYQASGSGIKDAAARAAMQINQS